MSRPAGGKTRQDQGGSVRNAIIGMIIGVVVGVAVGATVVAPRLTSGAGTAPPGIGPKAKAPLPATAKPERAERLAAAEPPAVETASPAPPREAAPAEPDKSAMAPPVQPPATAPEPKSAAAPAPTSAPDPTPEAAPKPEAAPENPAPPPGRLVEALPPEPEPVRWRMGSAYASTLPQLGTLAKKLDRDIWRVSDGTLEIKFFEPGALVPAPEMFEAVRAGAIDAAFSSPGFWGDKVPALQLFAAVPFGPTAQEFLAWIYFGGGRELFEDIYRAQGLHSVFCGLIAPEASGWFRKRIRTVDDLKGLRMRFFGLGAKVMQRLGVNITRESGGDIFVALESGAIDAAEFSMPAIDFKLGLHRMAKNYYFPGWHQPATLLELMVNLDKWKALTATQKAQVEAVCGDNIRYGLAEGEAAQFQALKALQAEGVQIRRWPGEIMEALNAAWGEVARDEAKRDREFRRVWKSMSGFRRNYAIWQELNRPY